MISRGDFPRWFPNYLVGMLWRSYRDCIGIQKKRGAAAFGNLQYLIVEHLTVKGSRVLSRGPDKGVLIAPSLEVPDLRRPPWGPMVVP